MNNILLVNKNKKLDKNYVSYNLVKTNSKYKDNVMLSKIAYDNFLKFQEYLQSKGISIDIESGYRDYNYQEKIYNKLVLEKGYNYAFKSIAKPGSSEHQTGLAIDFCLYKDDKCYIEHELEDLEELQIIHQKCPLYGFILRYPKNKEDITGYNYEPWHIRYIGPEAIDIYNSGKTLEEYLETRK